MIVVDALLLISWLLLLALAVWIACLIVQDWASEWVKFMGAKRELRAIVKRARHG